MRAKRIRVAHHPPQVDLLAAVGTRLLLPHDAPAADAELVEPAEPLRKTPVEKKAAREERLRIRVTTGQLEGVLDQALLVHAHQDLLPADGTRVLGQAPAGDPAVTVELNQATQR